MMPGKALLSKRRLQKTITDGFTSARDILSYLLIPLAVPLIFIQEIIAFVREKVGLTKRTLEGKVVLITGASSGIGESLAKSFYQAGCHLILVARRKTELDRVKHDLVLLKTDGRVHIPAVLEMDLGDVHSIPEKCKEALKIYGKIDILINNAGLGIRGTVVETEMEVQQKIMTVNYFGTLAITKALLPQMISRKNGIIVFMSSIQGRISIPERSGYAASKHAVQALADALRAEVYSDGIQVTTLSPGYVRTNFSINSVTPGGGVHGQMDKTTANGYSPQFIAKRTFKAILNGEKEVIIAPLIHKLAIFIRYLMPNTFFYLMAHRAKKTKSN